ncbi:hypothetical protein EES47_11645 [Streptomyces sp. ADI98-12]|nr:hypothetical protein EES47_11645 [Streptomyces sp. ADI98-12]
MRASLRHAKVLVMTSSSPQSGGVPARPAGHAPLGPLAQFGVALGLVVLETASAAAVLLFWFGAALHLDTGTPAPEVSPTPYLLALAAIGLCAGAAAFASGRRREWGVAVTQGLMAASLIGAALVGATLEARGAARDQPPPAAPGVAGCRSGDDSRECAHLGG